MSATLADFSSVVTQIDMVCLRLFDEWCDSRSVTPLAYLMHCWPMTERSLFSVQRLCNTLRELQSQHSEELDGEQSRQVCELIESVDALSEPGCNGFVLHESREFTAREVF